MTRTARARDLGRVALVAAGVLVADQVAKAVVEAEIDWGERVEVLPFLDLVRVSNEGIAFGLLGDGERGVVLAATVVALALIVGWYFRDPGRRWAWLATGLLVGGAVGNLTDRLARDAVVDFIDFPAWPSFNVADIAITVGAALLVLGALLGPDEPAEPSDAGRT